MSKGRRPRDQVEARRRLTQTVCQLFDVVDFPDALPALKQRRPGPPDHIGDPQRTVPFGRPAVTVTHGSKRTCRAVSDRRGLFLNFRQLLAGMEVIGVSHEERFRIIAQVALDGMKAGRRKVLGQLVDGSRHVTDVIAMRTGLSPTSARRHLEDLAAHGVVDLVGTRPGQWEASAWLQSHWWAVSGERPAETAGELLSLFPGAIDVTDEIGGASVTLSDGHPIPLSFRQPVTGDGETSDDCRNRES